MEKDRNDGIAPWFDLGHTIDLTPKEEEEEDFMELPAESKIGTKLTTVTLKKIILIVLLLMMSTPMFSHTYYFTEVQSLLFDVVQWGAVIQQTATQGSTTFDNYNEASAYYFRDTYAKKLMPILKMTAKLLTDADNEYVYIWTADPDAWYGLRNSEKNFALASVPANALNSTRHVDIYVEANVRAGKTFMSWLSIIKTFTVCVL